MVLLRCKACSGIGGAPHDPGCLYYLSRIERRPEGEPWPAVKEDPTTKPAEGRKNDDGKLRYDLIPPGPLARLAEVYTIGAKKYEDRNWEKGIKWGRIFGAMCRHAWAFWRGESLDQVDRQHHLASVAWCAFALMEYENTHPELDDRSKK